LSDAAQPFGSWAFDSYLEMPGWKDTPRVRNDVGVIWLQLGGSNNQPIGEAVGYVGRRYNRTLPGIWVDAGYPGGKIMYADQGRYYHSYDSGRAVTKYGEIQGGVSGGPWLNYDELSYASALHSGHVSDTEIAGPYFNDDTMNFIENNLR
jgi:hypothetical protein